MASSSDASGRINLQGKYQHVRSENLEDFLKEMGMNMMTRAVALKANPTLEVTQDGDNIEFKVTQVVFTNINKFTVGEDFEETLPNGIPMKAKAHWDNDKLVVEYEPKEGGKGSPLKQTRHLEGDQLILTIEFGEKVTKRVFKKET